MRQILKVLVVDDDPVERMAVCQCLRVTDNLLEICEASDGVGAIAILQQEKFDCVFLDYSLLEVEGLTFLEALCAAGVTVPVVVLTLQEDELAGASDYICKSKLSQLLSRSLANLIRIYRWQKQGVRERMGCGMSIVGLMISNW